MKKFISGKSNDLFLLNLTLIFCVLLFASLLELKENKFLVVIVIPGLFIMPILILIRSAKLIMHLFVTFIVTAIFVGFFGVCIKLIRDSLLYPKIGEQHAIGYEHFYNYPLNFDALVIYSLLSFPAIAVLLTWRILKKKN